mmetsp:Transcript_35066/g.71764  ORF Transcript_35066/g.71764 Transcript_35066/m.71764 type:complete len:218 (-) Transcript_35066:376-1029(-)
MREFQIDTPAMHVDAVPQILPSHSAAFQMPPRTSPPYRRIPNGVVSIEIGFVRLPEREVAYSLLVGVVFVRVGVGVGGGVGIGGGGADHAGDSGCLGLHGAHVEIHQLPTVPLLFPHREVPTPLLAPIRQIFCRQQLDQFHHFVYVFRRPRIPSRLHHIQSLQIIHEQPLEFPRQFHQPDPLPIAPRYDLIVHVRQIAHVMYVVPQMRQDALQDVVG